MIVGSNRMSRSLTRRFSARARSSDESSSVSVVLTSMCSITGPSLSSSLQTLSLLDSVGIVKVVERDARGMPRIQI